MAERLPTGTKPLRRHRALVFQLYLAIAVVAFLILAVLAKTVAYFTFDVTITQELQEFKPAWFGAVMYALSWIGFAPQVYVISLLTLLFLYFRGLKWESVVTRHQYCRHHHIGYCDKVCGRSSPPECRPRECH